MKKVKELCLGVAVAGMVAGAGTTVACAVASADAGSPDSTAAADSAQPGKSRAHTRVKSQPAAAAATSADNSAPRGTGGADAPRPTASARNTNRTTKPAAVTVPAPATQAGVPETAPAVEVNLPEPAPAVEVSAPAAAAVASPATPKPVAAVRQTKAAAAAAPAVPAAPLTPLIPLLPLPTPVLPVAPASSVGTGASPTSRRTVSASATASLVQIGDPTHVLLIGTDGTNLDKILADPANVGFFNLMNQSVTGATSIVGHTTISGPSWSTIMTGVWDNKTGVINNLFNPEPYTAWPTTINQLEYFDSSIVTSVVADWKYINDMGGAGGYPADVNEYFGFADSWAATDTEVVNKTIDLINATDSATPSFIFSYQVQVDEAGHEFGGGSAEYKQAVTNVSNNIADIMAAVDAVETATGQDWTVMVTTDHGHQQSVGFGHGFQSPNETSSFIIFDLAGDSANDGKQNLGYSNVDITPTIVSLFGAPARSDFDGVSLSTKTNSLVTPVNLNQALGDAVAANGYPNIGTDIALGVRTIFASVPYFIDGFFTSVTDQLQGIVDQNIFLLSGLAGITQWLVQITGDVAVGITQAVARVVAHLTGSGVIAPSDPPLPAPPAGSLSVPAIAALV